MINIKKKNILKFQIFSTIFSIALGTLLHFVFKWSGNNPIIGLFTPVNESTWEHLKLLFFPMFITTIIGFIIFKDDFPNYFCSKAIGILIALALVVVFFYTYTGIIGNNYSILDVGSFVVGIILGEYTSYKRLINNNSCNKTLYGWIIGFLLIAFIVFTFWTPRINLFKDPLNNSYGILNKKN